MLSIDAGGSRTFSHFGSRETRPCVCWQQKECAATLFLIPFLSASCPVRPRSPVCLRSPLEDGAPLGKWEQEPA